MISAPTVDEERIRPSSAFQSLRTAGSLSAPNPAAEAPRTRSLFAENLLFCNEYVINYVYAAKSNSKSKETLC